MEKLLEFEKTKHDTTSKFYRFQCDCLDASDAMDINIDSSGKDSEGKWFTIYMSFIDPNFWRRIKFAWAIVRGHWSWRDFVVRQEDAKNLSELFNPDKKFSELP